MWDKKVKNLQMFNECVGLIFAHLIDNFPNKIILRCSDIIEGKQLEGVTQEFVSECIEFLYDEGFITYHEKSPSGTMFSFARLSLKGLVVLNSVPKNIEKGENAAQLIKKNATSAGWGVLGDVVANILTAWVLK